jgi:O-antigen ligase
LTTHQQNFKKLNKKIEVFEIMEGYHKDKFPSNFLQSNKKNSFIFLSWIVFLFSTFLLGGGQTKPNLQFTIIFFFGAVLSGVLVFDWKQTSFSSLSFAEKVALSFVVAVPVMQLVPLPPAVWQCFEGRSVEHILRSLTGNESGYFPMTLSPADTTQYLLALLILFGSFLAVRTFTLRERQLAIHAVTGLAGVTVLVGMLQVASNGAVLEFYFNSHRGYLLGFFANRNHTGLFLAIGIICLVNSLFSLGKGGNSRIVFGALGILFLISGIAATGSRMGLALGLVATLMAILIHWRPTSEKNRKVITVVVGVGIIAALSLASSSVFNRTVDRFDNVNVDQRWQIWPNSVSLGHSYAPVGVGIGGFEGAYAKQEKLVEVRPEYVNNVHNDYIEIFVEAGWLGIFVFALVIVVIALAAFRVFRFEAGIERNQRLCSALVLFLILLHSVVDYPMRRMFIASIAFFALACLLGSRSNSEA